MGVCGSKAQSKDTGAKSPGQQGKDKTAEKPAIGGAKIEEIKVQEKVPEKNHDGKPEDQKPIVAGGVHGEHKPGLEKPTTEHGKPEANQGNPAQNKPGVTIADNNSKPITPPATSGTQGQAGATGQQPKPDDSLKPDQGSPNQAQPKASPAVDQDLAKQKAAALEEIKKTGTDENVRVNCPKDTPIVVTENVKLTY